MILENIRRLSHGAVPMVIRIPGVNDSAQDMRAFASVISALGEAVQGVELLRYNNLAGGAAFKDNGHAARSACPGAEEALRGFLSQGLKKVEFL